MLGPKKLVVQAIWRFPAIQNLIQEFLFVLCDHRFDGFHLARFSSVIQWQR